MSSQEFKVSARKRESFGSSVTRRMRRDGAVPVVVYSRGDEPLPLSITYPEATRLSHHHGIVQLGVEGRKKTVNVVVKDLQYHPVSGNILHIDCLGVRMDEEITVSVPLEATGEAAGTHEGGVLEQLEYELDITCLPGNVPEMLQVDVSELEVGDSLTIANLPLPEGVKVTGESDQDLFVISLPTEEPEEEEEGEEGEELAEPEVISKGGETEEEEDAE